MTTPTTPETPKLSRNRRNLDDTKKSVEIGELFVLKYDSKLPEDLGSLYCWSMPPHYDVDLMRRTDEDRTKALAFIGDTLGRGGWTATASKGYGFQGFDWERDIDGVRVKIEGAQKIDSPNSFPVDPKQFPLQLEDAQ